MPVGLLWFGGAVGMKSGLKLKLQLFSRAIFKQYQFHPETQGLPTNTPTPQLTKSASISPESICTVSVSVDTRLRIQIEAGRKPHQDCFGQSSAADPVLKLIFLFFHHHIITEPEELVLEKNLGSRREKQRNCFQYPPQDLREE